MTRDDLREARLKRLTSASPATTRELARRGIDLDACLCADLGHHWRQTELGRQTSGALKGLPARILTCAGCNSQRVDILTWSGRTVSQHYVHDPAYLDNLRALDDDQYARRAEYRRLMISRLPGPRDGKVSA